MYNTEWLTRSGIGQTLGIALAAFLIMVAFFIKIPTLVRNGAYSLAREALKQKAVWTTRDMETIQSEHFIIRYTRGNEQDAKLVMETAEHFYQPIVQKYGYDSRSKIPVIVYPSRPELNRNFGWQANESAMGVYWAGIIRVLSPNVWITDRDPGEYKEIFMNSGPMAHEFTHLVVDYLTSGNYTRWFTEGMAQYEEYKLTGFAFDEPETLLRQQFYSLSEMDANFDNLPDQALAYRQSFLAVRYIAEEYGEEYLKAILNSLAKGDKMDEAITNALGADMKKFETDYRQWAIEKEGRL